MGSLLFGGHVCVDSCGLWYDSSCTCFVGFWGFVLICDDGRFVDCLWLVPGFLFAICGRF